MLPRRFLDVQRLLESSQVVRRPPWLWYATGLFMAFIIGSAFASSRSEQLGALIGALSGLLMIGVMIGTAGLLFHTARAYRSERQAVEAVEELVQLRRWQEAAALLEQLLSRPMRAVPHRVQALIYLASVLARYHRFGDAIAVQEYLLEQVPLDGGIEGFASMQGGAAEMSAHGLRLGRAMALLHDDRLFDADRAINDLRRSPMAEHSGGLALVEIYRDVKTGHPAEAVAMFESRLPQMRQQMGHRLGDAYALAARAYAMLNRPIEAQQAFERATLLCPWVELKRRYPETRVLEEKYTPATVPAELA